MGDTQDNGSDKAEELLREVLPPCLRVSVDELLNPQKEYDCIASISDETLADEIVHEMDASDQEVTVGNVNVDGDEDFIDLTPYIPENKELMYLNMSIWIMNTRGICSSTPRREIVSAQRVIRAEIVNLVYQISFRRRQYLSGLVHRDFCYDVFLPKHLLLVMDKFPVSCHETFFT